MEATSDTHMPVGKTEQVQASIDCQMIRLGITNRFYLLQTCDKSLSARSIFLHFTDIPHGTGVNTKG